VAPGVRDSVVGRWGQQNGAIFNPSQHLAGLGRLLVKTTLSLRVSHPSYAVENRVVVVKLAVYEQKCLRVSRQEV
jgi:hypothetical protein